MTRTLLAALLGLALAACQGDRGPAGAAGAAGQDGQDGQDGQNGTDGQDGQDAVIPPGAGLKLQIQNTAIAADGTVTVTFSAKDASGAAVDVIAEKTTSFYPRFTLAAMDATGAYQALLLASGRPTSDRNGALAQVSAGVFTYTFVNKVLGNDAAKTHRVGLWMNRPFDGVNYPASTTYDFVPGGGTPVTREVVADASCNACHGKLTLHGSRRTVALCETCHTSQLGTAELGVMAHKIHAGAHLANGYTVGGHDYSEVEYPLELTNCTSCHAGANADNFKTKPSRAACGACHDTVDFATGANHGPGSYVVKDDSTCALCHDASSIASKHVPSPGFAAAANFKYEIVSVTNTAPGQMPTVVFKVTNPTSGAAYDLKTDPAFTAAGGASSLAVKIGWSATEFQNVGAGQVAGQPVSINALSTAAVANGDGTYTVTSTIAVPADATGTGMVTLEGHPAVTVGTTAYRIPAKNVFAYFPITDTTVKARRAIVSIDKCNACHGDLSLHGNNRTDSIEGCVMCHNPNATDVSRRPAGTAGVDGLAEQTIDFKVMVHAIHAKDIRTTNFVVYGYGGSVNTFPLGFPGELRNCQTCHNAGTYGVPLKAEVLGSTISTGLDTKAVTDNVRALPTAAVCASCHDSTTTAAHMQTMSVEQVETCTYCHGPGMQYDVNTVHGALP